MVKIDNKILQFWNHLWQPNKNDISSPVPLYRSQIGANYHSPHIRRTRPTPIFPICEMVMLRHFCWTYLLVNTNSSVLFGTESKHSFKMWIFSKKRVISESIFLTRSASFQLQKTFLVFLCWKLTIRQIWIIFIKYAKFVRKVKDLRWW